MKSVSNGISIFSNIFCQELLIMRNNNIIAIKAAYNY